MLFHIPWRPEKETTKLWQLGTNTIHGVELNGVDFVPRRPIPPRSTVDLQLWFGHYRVCMWVPRVVDVICLKYILQWMKIKCQYKSTLINLPNLYIDHKPYGFAMCNHLHTEMVLENAFLLCPTQNNHCSPNWINFQHTSWFCFSIFVGGLAIIHKRNEHNVARG